MIQSINLGFGLCFFAKWAKRKMDESEASTESQRALLALHKKHGIRFKDASGTIHAFEQPDHELCGGRDEDRPSVMVDARSIHVHFHYQGSQTD